jgi:hypothetical protein
MSGQSRVKELVQQINKLSAALEDLNDENSLLRRKAGIPEGAPLDIQGLKMQKEITIAQLRSVNALLERQVGSMRGAVGRSFATGSLAAVDGWHVLRAGCFWCWLEWLAAVSPGQRAVLEYACKPSAHLWHPAALLLCYCLLIPRPMIHPVNHL